MISRSVRDEYERNLWLLFALVARHVITSKKKGHGNHHGPPVPPPANPPPPVDPGPVDPPPGGNSDLNFGSVGKYNPVGHPYTDRAPSAVLPTSYLHTQYGYDTAGAAIGAFVDVNLVDLGSRSSNTASLNSAIEAARVLNQNTRIILPAGFNAYAPVCKEITNAGKWIYIQGPLPSAEGTRTNPGLMATAPSFMVQNTELPAIYFWRKAARYYITGCTFEMNPTLSHTYFLVHLVPRENDDEYPFTIDDINDEIIISRCWVKGLDTATGNGGACRVGVFLNAKRSAVVDCWISGISETPGGEGKAILITNTPGPVKVVNNYLEASSINGLIGGEIPKYGAVTGKPTNIEWRRNHHTKPKAWSPTDLTWDGVSGRNGKPLMELKNVDKILFEGNTLNNCWADGQAGMIFVLKSAGDGRPGVGGIGCQTKNATIRYNKLYNSVRGWNTAGISDDDGATLPQDIAIYDNVMYEIGTYAGQTSGIGWLITQRVDGLYIRHNTLIHNEFTNGNFQFAYQQNPRAQNFTFSDNITTTGASSDAAPGGLVADGAKYGADALNSWAENPYWQRNILIGPYDPLIVTLNTFTGTQIVTNVAAMNFANAAGNNYRLTASSPGYQAGVNSKNLGADHDKIDLATSGVE